MDTRRPSKPRSGDVGCRLFSKRDGEASWCSTKRAGSYPARVGTGQSRSPEAFRWRDTRWQRRHSGTCVGRVTSFVTVILGAGVTSLVFQTPRMAVVVRSWEWIPKCAREAIGAVVRTIFAQPDHATAMTQLWKVAEGLRARFAQAAALLEDAAEDIPGVPASASRAPAPAAQHESAGVEQRDQAAIERRQAPSSSPSSRYSAFVSLGSSGSYTKGLCTCSITNQ
jgi:hypothetical protein